MQHPKKPHLETVQRILRYVKDIMVSYTRSVMSVSWSTTTMLIMPDITLYVDQLLDMCSSLVQEQYPSTVKDKQYYLLSTTEAEYRIGALAAQENTWLVQLMKDLNQPIEYAVSLYCDNQYAIRLAENSIFHAQTKHVEVHYHFLIENVLQEEIDMLQVKTKE